MTVDEAARTLMDAIQAATLNDPAVAAAIAAFPGSGVKVSHVWLSIYLSLAELEKDGLQDVTGPAESDAEFLHKMRISPDEPPSAPPGEGAS